MEPKSVQNGIQSGFGRALIEDSDSKPKKERVESIGGALGSTNLRILVPLGGGKQGGGKWFHTPDVPWTSQGVGGLLEFVLDVYCVAQISILQDLFMFL